MKMSRKYMPTLNRLKTYTAIYTYIYVRETAEGETGKAVQLFAVRTDIYIKACIAGLCSQIGIYLQQKCSSESLGL
jgi:hypothetical protein